MSQHAAPGLGFEAVQPVRPAGRLARSDIPLFLGYARRGPVGVPLRVGSRRLFETYFGPGVAGGHLAPAVAGFFECGGDAAYVIRVADGTQTTAAAVSRREGGLPWTITASFPWDRIDPERLGADRAPARAWAAVHSAFRSGPRLPDPGGWANGLEVRFARAPRVNTQTLPGALDEGFESRVAGLAGLELASVLELHQDVFAAGAQTHVSAVLIPDAIDPVRETLRWPVALQDLGFDTDAPIRLESVEFDVIVSRAGREEERLEGLSPNPAHSRAITGMVNAAMRDIGIAAPAGDWTDPASWPAETTVTLSGGSDGLAEVAGRHYLSALAAGRDIEDVALLAAPDLMAAPETIAPAPPGPAPVRDCSDLSPTPQARLTGRVTSGATGRPLANVRVDAAASGRQVTTDALGLFAVDGLEPRLQSLRLTRAGYFPLDTLVQAAADPERAELQLSPTAAPRKLSEDERLEVAKAMTNPQVAGPYRVAILDPPAPDLTVRGMRAWRSRLGDTQRGGFYVPWLTTAEGPVPPSGHVCGIIARAARETGPVRAGANIGLRHADGVTVALDEATHGLLNGEGINAIRALPGRGLRVMGTRSLSSDPEWRFLTSRRLIDVLERTLERMLQWAVFEPNGIVTRQAIAFQVRGLLTGLWQAGNLAGAAPAEAFRVRVDAETTTPADEATGRLIAEIAVAPAIPLEFIRLRLGRTLDAIEVTEH